MFNELGSIKEVFIMSLLKGKYTTSSSALIRALLCHAVHSDLEPKNAPVKYM